MGSERATFETLLLLSRNVELSRVDIPAAARTPYESDVCSKRVLEFRAMPCKDHFAHSVSSFSSGGDRVRGLRMSPDGRKKIRSFFAYRNDRPIYFEARMRNVIENTHGS